MRAFFVFILLWAISGLSLKAQVCLRSGIYHNLKPTEPVLLDTGTYTFVGLQMTDMGPGIWLNAGKARKLELLHCTFEGKDEGTAVLSSGDLTVSHCTFAQMENGILQASPPGSKRKVAITSNVFKDNGTSIRLEVSKRDEGISVRGDMHRGGAKPKTYKTNFLHV